MMNTNKKTPKLRFKGFTDDWEQCKLGDIATLSKGNGYSKSDLSASGNPIILYGRLYTNYETTIRNVDTFVKLKDKSVISQGGEVIVPASGETAEDISRASVVKNQGVIIGGDLNVIKVNILLDPTFLALTISNGEQQKELSKRAQGKSVVHLHNSDLQEVNLIFPLLNEQRKISTLFEKMDNIITLHQCKLEKLKLNKSALLQKLFPQNGCTIPEIRFKEFTGAWEQRKFSDLYEKISEKNDLSYSLDKIISVANMYYKSDAKVSNEEYLKTYNIFRYGEIAFEGNKSKDFAYGRFVENTIGDGIISHVFEVFRPIAKYDIYFWKYYINYEPIMGKILSRCTKKTTMMTNLVAKDFLKETVLVPTLAEQKQIGTLLNAIDKFITLHQRKLDRLISIKKGLLQQLFV